MSNDSSDRSLSSVITWNKDVKVMPYALFGVVALIVGAVAAIMTLINGHDTMFNLSPEVPWGLLIASYAFFVLTASGLAFIGGIGHAFGNSAYLKINRRIVVMAFAVLLAGFTQIGMELGHPLRLAWYMLVSPNFSAPITWMGVLYSIELLILAFELYLVLKPNPTEKDHRNSAVVGFCAMIFGVLAAATLGFVFGSNTARPFFHGSYFSTFFVVSGITAGAAMLLFVHNLVYWGRVPSSLSKTMSSLGKLMATGIGVMIFLYLWKILATVYTPAADGGYAAIRELLSGSLSTNFWGGEILLAIVLPLFLVLITKAQSMKMLGLAGFIYIVGFFFTKYDFIIAGQVPVGGDDFIGSGINRMADFQAYVPASGEWLIMLLGCGVFFTFYFFAEKILVLEKES
ncbi:oxidoreductase [Pseudodesulfovibrio nedwellii]|uniref:Oxidoreductase n=1 Tax=Pseudodesulfovibrio nedwellii TaxID=2973072 RepID=A0ABN6S5D4_9BACT|nr:NrfD/PsrC family molybdoenzyme membrane anchor subunit [Pseudodesulfovibrio nedwellii]BDQ37233.1 oxidoreductase [Pseudodesulfovibrio nedwellii]